ncbi:MAG TPA: molybdenum cofactor biosynthesis protein MoaE [Candidatus Deferrimicrobiaceae bacterium]|nr:molybdenum cofactor biosynthesis protein MoaE [Candidatus Deferrimicrobiaceae bacterium]
MVNSGVHEKGTFTAQDVIENIKRDPNYRKAGAIALFIGVVRGETLDTEKGQVQGLTIEAYEEKADEVLAKISGELAEKPGIVNVQIHHLLGDFEVGDELVYVAVAGGHRTDVFPILREAVERYKSEVPVFKKERIINTEGKPAEYWVAENHSNHL